MVINIKFYKIKLIIKSLNRCSLLRQHLLDELIIYATDEVLLKRRVRMLAQLSQYESQLLQKIYNFDTDNLDDLDLAWSLIEREIEDVCHRSA